ncbi:MAG: hypothetical protein K2W82_10705 [Candidatus Obscuribacterales bacterium]|nr:hypothetical protein [Candidatus Obscuribacterales bacterium]
MRAFQNEQRLKAVVLESVAACQNREQSKDWLLNRRYYTGENAVVHGPGRAAYDAESGVYLPLMFAVEAVLLGLPEHLAQDWLSDFFKALPVGADSKQIWGQFVSHFLSHPLEGVITRAMTEAESEALERVAQLHRNACEDFAVWNNAIAQAADAEPTTRPFRKEKHGYVPSTAAYHAACTGINSFANAPNAFLFCVVLSEYLTDNKPDSYCLLAQKILQIMENL